MRGLMVSLVLSLGMGLACGRIPPDLAGWAAYYARGYGLDPDLLIALVWVESRFCPDAVSPDGAVGLGQIMPATGKAIGISRERLFHPQWNLWGAARHLRQLWDSFRDWPLALAAYNAGSGAVRKYRGIPPYPETQKYVRDVLWVYRWLKRNRKM
ncbi:lytic transglycosylase domain-containing protein [Meiothermus sp. PNK-Is4]|uniref:Lytic transglycosylase catalytic n=1 Tax=Allomeiothermus silvanus (strain ATCC 700542 / DSM 9946 / NBRC 106475 / NCIMB 13440 / VI-R2) TaxID=526227 RepID=D7BA11_ALLS1|nr:MULTISPECIES: lytic transglycosylase domain-containing protein [Thermaceae]ADH62445.1 Lytic transglycosylase catalytic [Allomeiothermus silvanus DSM 9946]RYM39479.1 lytic transglycosylase domain-containing protein [Meiothermus sp. PNK-Is4]